MFLDIEDEFKEVVKNISCGDIEEEITEDDVKSWGYDNLDDFWESNT